ncbi:hypothetical protein [Pseudomonas aeruginosa]|uniref:hypothetical protein n=1 Tax=Pseudomonas aeruginosa TaxID=287 RepID=UPI0013727C5A|nr:hypothetical protein [Pseudomonas aeruginosa]NBK54252.1 hypothetical protein [Pseudomonas aeruginosa]
MTRSNSWRFPWLFNRRVGFALLWSALVLGAAVAVNLAGIRIVGGIDGWERWLRAHAVVFLAWRLCLYTGTAWGWCWMRRRVQQREAATEARQRFLRIEVAAVTAIVLMEGGAWLQRG